MALLPSRLILLAITVAAAPSLHAQSSCSSDGVARPVALVERFINADCEACWSDTKARQPADGEVALDWIVPGSRGDDAPLSAAARRDGLQRLAALKRAVPAQSDTVRSPIVKNPRTLRVAQGLPFNGYVGASIALKPGAGGPWTAWLALVESVPAGTDGSPVARNLVRNVLQPPWDSARPLSKKERSQLFETRSMNVPEGANLDRLRVVGWVEDVRGRIVAAAQSRCETTQ